MTAWMLSHSLFLSSCAGHACGITRCAWFLSSLNREPLDRSQSKSQEDYKKALYYHQKALEHIGLVPRERGWATAHTIDWLPLPTQTAIMVFGSC
jgi:hypothetical protein